MRKPFGASLRIGVSADAVSLLAVRRWGGAAPQLLAERALEHADGAAQHAAIGAALQTLLAGGDYAGWPVAFVLAEDCVRLWQVTPPVGVAGLTDLQAAAALRFQTLYGEPMQGWSMLAAWDSQAAFFAAAASQALLDTLAQVAQAHKLAVVGITPHFISAWNRWQGALKANAWFGLAHDGLLHLGAVEEAGTLAAVRTLPLPAAADHDWLTQMLGREALLLDLAPPALLQLCGQVPALLCKPAADPQHIQSARLDAAQQAAMGQLSPAAMLALSGEAR